MLKYQLTAVPISYRLSHRSAPALFMMPGAPLLALTPARRSAAGLAAEHHTSLFNLSAFASRASWQGSELGRRAPDLMGGREGVWMKTQKPTGAHSYVLCLLGCESRAGLSRVL